MPFMRSHEVIKIRPSIKVSVSGLISQRDENANKKIMHINHTMKAVCLSRGWLFIDYGCLNTRLLSKT